MPCRDSWPEVERLQIERWGRMSALDKARLVDSLGRATQELALTGIRQRHPHATEQEGRLRLAALKLGPQLAARGGTRRRTESGEAPGWQGATQKHIPENAALFGF